MHMPSEFGVINKSCELVYSNEGGRIVAYPIVKEGEHLTVNYSFDGIIINDQPNIDLNLEPIYVQMCRPSPFDDEDGLFRRLTKFASKEKFIEYREILLQDYSFGI